MKILIFSDIHGDHRALAKIVAQPADLYIDVGDLATFGRGLDRCGEILMPLGQKLWVLPGNHVSHDHTRAFCERFGFVDFHRRVYTLESSHGVTQWAGLGYSNITPFNTPGEYSEEEIAKALASFDGITPLYLVAHCPPKDTKLDEFAPGRHAGSSAIREWVELAQPRHLYCGHNHDPAGMNERRGSTQCFNVGKQGYLLEI